MAPAISWLSFSRAFSSLKARRLRWKARKMNYDISSILEEWPFDPDDINARRIRTKEGVEKVQIRIDMGILQLEVEGRPDGKKPHGVSSLLDHYLFLLEEKPETELVLDEDACEDLFQEAWQYYHRYLSLFHLEDFKGVVEDTEHNLEIFVLVQDYASSDEARWYFEQYFPHAVMMQARAKAMTALDAENYPEALQAIKAGIAEIESFLEAWEGESLDEDFPELAFLREWHDELEKERPLSKEEEIERDLQIAVEAENFEEAARLRDKLKNMGLGNFPPHSPFEGKGRRSL